MPFMKKSKKRHHLTDEEFAELKSGAEEALAHAQGKKLKWRDGVACIAILLRVRFSAERSGHRRRMRSRSVGTVDLKHTEHAKP